MKITKWIKFRTKSHLQKQIGPTAEQAKADFNSYNPNPETPKVIRKGDLLWEQAKDAYNRKDIATMKFKLGALHDLITQEFDKL